jgi:heme exporter protein D
VSALLEFLAMGGYAAYVWPAFGLATTVLAVLLWNSIARLKSREATLRALEGTGTRRRDRPDET